MKGLILALPRSRTSWLSFALGATHEYLSNGGSLRALPDDTLCVEINPTITYPRCPTVVIHRDVQEVSESLSYFDNALTSIELLKECNRYSEALNKATKARNATVVEFKDITDSREVFEKVLGIKIDKARWDFLSCYRVEPMAEDLSLIINHKNYA